MKILSTIITSPLLFKKSPKFHFSLKFPSPHNITNAKTNPQTLSRIAMATCIGAAQPSPFSGDPTRPQQGDSSAAAGTNGLNILKLSRRNFSDQVPKSTAASATAFQDVATARKPIRTVDYDGEVFSDRRNHLDEFWREIRSEAISDSDSEPVLKQYYSASILSHVSLESALANQLSLRLGSSLIPSQSLYEIFLGELRDEVAASVRSDLRAAKERDPACISYVQCLLSFKGFLAIQAHRISNRLWSNGRKVLALTIQSRVSEVFAVDIHPGAIVGRGVLLDHATGVVVGETAVIGDQVSILHNVTLGGTGKSGGDRHPKIGNGVLIGAGTCILGNIRIGEGAKIGAGSVVLKDVPAWTTAVGNPARLLGGKNNPVRNDGVPGLTMDHTSNISDWSDYVI